MAIRKLPDRDLVRQLLHYDAATGEFTWLPRPREMFVSDGRFNTWNKRFADKRAGNYDAHGYRTICIQWQKYKAHRLAWLYVRGEPVPDQIDHVDRVHDNNRIGNLRAATGSQNHANKTVPPNTKSGVKGVTLRRGRFSAHIKRNRKTIYLGDFDTIEKAAQAYQDAAVRLFGEFAYWD